MECVGSHHCSASSNPGERLTPAFFTGREERVHTRVQSVIDERGYFAVTKYTGTFICS
ncbi:hypothetical protein [Streptomyces racemochromogenes]|uniref:hypothetical protein n=1 Tax=Streptomyces racemochromogenes TaxID=67353 RepID=UPI0031F06383